MLEIQKFNKIIVANWKMNGTINFIDNFIKQLSNKNNLDPYLCAIICPPFAYINHISYQLNNNYYLGGQDCSLFLKGPYTGDISASMLSDIGCNFCIIGHSERRTKYKESNNEVAVKAVNSLNNNINPIICVGETFQQKQTNQTKEIISEQIRTSVPKFSTNNNTIIAYEPVWSIGTGLTPSIEEINDIHCFIKNEIKGYENYKIIYGGSVKSTNSKEISNLENVDGVLVGGASLHIEEFNNILLN